MTLITCLHPKCNVAVVRGCVCCPRHYYALPDELRRQLSRLSAKPKSTVGALKVQVREYFESRLIGDHEIVTCRKIVDNIDIGCGQDIVWLRTATGKKMPVNPGHVKADDELFEYGRHIAHWHSCPNAEKFRKP